MVVEAVSLVAHQFSDHLDLVEGIADFLPVVECQLILHVEGLRHVHAVEPNLIRIESLVPEHAFLGARLVLKLPIDGVHSEMVLFLVRQLV